MALMRSTVRPFVRKQLNIREGILKLGNPNENSRYNSTKVDGVNIPAGAFYTNTTSRQCVIRMYSGVDIEPGTFPGYKTEPNGVRLAKQWLLEGGTGWSLNHTEIDCFFIDSTN